MKNGLNQIIQYSIAVGFISCLIVVALVVWIIPPTHPDVSEFEKRLKEREERILYLEVESKYRRVLLDSINNRIGITGERKERQDSILNELVRRDVHKLDTHNRRLIIEHGLSNPNLQK